MSSYLSLYTQRSTSIFSFFFFGVLFPILSHFVVFFYLLELPPTTLLPSSSTDTTSPTKTVNINLQPHLTSSSELSSFSSSPPGSKILLVPKRRLGPSSYKSSNLLPPSKKIRLSCPTNLVTVPLQSTPAPANPNLPLMAAPSQIPLPLSKQGTIASQDSSTATTSAPFTNGVQCPISGCHAPRLGDVFKYYSHLYTMHLRRALRCPVASCKVAFGTFSLTLLDHHDDRRHNSPDGDDLRRCVHCGLTFASFTTAAFHAFDVHAKGEWHCQNSGCEFTASTRAEWVRHEEECVTRI